MPENEFPKLRPHPAKADAGGPVARPSSVGFAELCATSNFTFLTGASHPEELVDEAARLGHRAVSVADTNTLAGVVRAHVAAKRAGLALVVGSRVTPQDAPPLFLYPTDRGAYAGLCRLLTLGKRRAPKGECHLTLHDVLDHARGLVCVVEPPEVLDDVFVQTVRGLGDVFDDDRLSIAAWFGYRGEDHARLGQVADCCEHVGVPMVATNRPLYHGPGRRALQDVVTCIRRGCTIEQAGFALEANAERHLKSPEEMARLFAGFAGAVARSVEIAERCVFGLDELRYEYPAEACPAGMSATAYLRRETWAGALARYGVRRTCDIPERTRRSIEHELALIEELGYEAYFLTCYDIVSYARSVGILCQGRGGAANSAVCYCLRITEVDPATHHLLFERFVSRERAEPPDIDIDFEHERREEVIQYLYRKYGRERAALTAEVISYRGRSAIREVAKAMGLPSDAVDALAKNLDRWDGAASAGRVRETGLNPDDPTIARVLALSAELVGFPRHLSQHVGGFVITRGPLCDMVPIENAAMADRTVIEWDKDDIDAMGMLKVDCLGLGMLTCVRKAIGFVLERERGGGQAEPPITPDALTLPATHPVAPDAYPLYARIANDPTDVAVYDMISAADTVGVFQIESRAQMSMLPRLRPRAFYDLVIEVAIVRPGPIQGGIVHPYLRRREGKEEVEYPSEEVREVLGRTLGVPLFQEQAMQLAIVAAGFTPDEADGLRRSMAAWKRQGNAIARYGERLIEGMVRHGYERGFAERCFEQVKGFSEYGFPESHAASFAIIVYVSCWLKRHHPAAYAAALINSQPMGFYQPAQIVRDAQEHGVEVRAVDVNFSGWDCSLEPRAGGRGRVRGSGPETWGLSGPAVRLGMRMVKGLGAEDAARIERARASRGGGGDWGEGGEGGEVCVGGWFETVEALWRASGVSVRGLRALANADAFGSMGLDRRQALWQIKALRDEELPLFAGRDGTDDRGLDRLPEASAVRRVIEDYGATGLSLKAHPLSFLRGELDRRGVTPAGDLRSAKRCPDKSRVVVAGVVLCRQRPGTASGVTFITLEDETGIANLVVWRDTFEKYRRVGRLSTMLLVRGTIEREGEVVHVHARHLESLDGELPRIRQGSRDFH